MKILEYIKKMRHWHLFMARKEFLELQDEFLDMQDQLFKTQDSILIFIEAFHENELLMRNDMRLMFNEINSKAKPKEPVKKKNGTGHMYG